MTVSIDYRSVAAKSIGEEAGNAADGGNADTREIVNLAIGKVLLQVFNHLPAVHERLKLRWCTQVFEEIPALCSRSKANDGLEKRVLCGMLLTL